MDTMIPTTIYYKCDQNMFYLHYMLIMLWNLHLLLFVHFRRRHTQVGFQLDFIDIFG